MLPLLAIVIGAVLIPLLAWRIVGERRKRDPLLLPLLIVALGFTVGALADVLVFGERPSWTLLFGVAGLVTTAVRWRASDVADSPAA